MAQVDEKIPWKTESYVSQVEQHWPRTGRHILAQYDDNSVVVYQAFRPEIAEYAVKNQRFGGPHYKWERMSWIKPNFLWMMYRCGWASKQGQERVLAVRITRKGFDEILSNAYTPKTQGEAGLSKAQITVRLQWDPDHDPSGNSLQRRAIQLGLKGETLSHYAQDWIVSITDITDFVHEQHNILQNSGTQELQVAAERVYQVNDPKTKALIGVEDWESS
ncbi:uncharacterized protein [Branchiostoma lanceolatum]|uniref:uncharacterized protein n=1 Tax=Branchiostoma lanceolatum TaxID=7740 RepID=UPI00345279F6